MLDQETINFESHFDNIEPPSLEYQLEEMRHAFEYLNYNPDDLFEEFEEKINTLTKKEKNNYELLMEVLTGFSVIEEDQ